MNRPFGVYLVIILLFHYTCKIFTNYLYLIIITVHHHGITRKPFFRTQFSLRFIFFLKHFFPLWWIQVVIDSFTSTSYTIIPSINPCSRTLFHPHKGNWINTGSVSWYWIRFPLVKVSSIIRPPLYVGGLINQLLVPRRDSFFSNPRLSTNNSCSDQTFLSILLSFQCVLQFLSTIFPCY